MATFNTEAIVLKQFDLGEADKIITFYSKDKGKIRAVARNVRKGKNTISGVVLPFTYCEITIYRGRSLDRINQIKNKFAFAELREDLTKMAYASYMAEVVTKVGMEDDPNQNLFLLLLSTFHKMLTVPENKLDYLNLIFKVKALVSLGFRPQLTDCLQCEQKVKISSRNYFDIAEGGIICNNCVQPEGENIVTLSGESLMIFKKMLNAGLNMPDNLQISATAIKQLDYLLDHFIIYHLDIKLKSQKFLYMIRDLG